MSSILGPIQPSSDPSKKRPVSSSDSTASSNAERESQKIKTSSVASASLASPELISHLEKTLTLERPRWDYQFTEHDFAYLTEGAEPFRRLSFQLTPPPSWVLAKVVERSRDTLQQVYLQSWKEPTLEFFSQLAHCTQLRELDTPYCKPLNSAMIALIAKIFSLQRLNFSGCEQLNDADLQVVAAGNPQLHILIVENCTKLTDRGVEWLAEKAQKLEELNLYGCSLITDRALQALAQHASTLTSLRTLDVSNAEGISDEGVTALVQKIKLQSLSLASCRRITDASLRALASHAKGLQSLSIVGCENVYSEGIAALAEGCKDLKRLGLSGTSCLPGFTFNTLARNLRGLEYLGMSQMGWHQIASLPQSFPQLRELNISGIDSYQVICPPDLDDTCTAIKEFCRTSTTLRRILLPHSTRIVQALGNDFYAMLRERKIQQV